MKIIQKIVISLVSIILSLVNTHAQSELKTAEEVIQKYISAIGGLKQINKIKSIQIVEERTFYEDTVKQVRKIVKNQAFSLLSASKGEQQKAIVKNNMGVNITPKGTFNMPVEQLKRYKREMSIIPEVNFLNSDYSIKLKGLTKLNDTLSVYEVEISDTNGLIETRAYNQKSGLLYIVMNPKNELTYFSNYQKMGKIHFPFTKRFQKNITTIIDFNLRAKFKEDEFTWNNEQDMEMIGTWLAKKEKKANGQTEYFEIEFYENRGGKVITGVYLETGEKMPVEFLTQNVVGWEILNKGIKLSYYNSAKNLLYQRYLIIKERKAGEIYGYFSDSENDNEESDPIFLTFKKTSLESLEK